MANITADMVKALRDKTGAGMADCKNALVESNGELEGAIEYLRKKGAAAAAKREDRDTNEGVVLAKLSADGQTAAFTEVTCETDFVARNAEFLDFVERLSSVVLDKGADTKEDLMQTSVNGDTVEGMYNGILAKFSEKIEVGRFKKLTSAGSFASYIHGGNKLAVVVEVSEPNLSDEAKAVVKDIAMQVAAMNPMFVDRSQVTADVLEKEKEIYTEQLIAEGKKPEIAEKAASGRVEKFYKENCLVEQQFVKDGSKNVSDVLKEIKSASGNPVNVLSFHRISIGG